MGVHQGKEEKKLIYCLLFQLISTLKNGYLYAIDIPLLGIYSMQNTQLETWLQSSTIFKI